MSDAQTLRIGDTVMWSGAWGTNAPRPATVTGMQRVHPGEKYGHGVEAMRWEDVPDRAVVSLANGHWAYGHQIAPMPLSEAERPMP
jgi:hypothetical protein